MTYSDPSMDLNDYFDSISKKYGLDAYIAYRPVDNIQTAVFRNVANFRHENGRDTIKFENGIEVVVDLEKDTIKIYKVDDNGEKRLLESNDFSKKRISIAGSTYYRKQGSGDEAATYTITFDVSLA